LIGKYLFQTLRDGLVGGEVVRRMVHSTGLGIHHATLDPFLQDLEGGAEDQDLRELDLMGLQTNCLVHSSGEGVKDPSLHAVFLVEAVEHHLDDDVVRDQGSFADALACDRSEGGASRDILSQDAPRAQVHEIVFLGEHFAEGRLATTRRAIEEDIHFDFFHFATVFCTLSILLFPPKYHSITVSAKDRHHLHTFMERIRE
jgi:hypothetical protein